LFLLKNSNKKVGEKLFGFFFKPGRFGSKDSYQFGKISLSLLMYLDCHLAYGWLKPGISAKPPVVE